MTDNSDVPVADVSAAPLPTAKTLRQRRSLPMQSVRFALTNLRMLRMIFRGHGEPPSPR